MLLRRKLRSEGIEDVEIEANEVVDVHGGQLAAIFAMTFPRSLSNERKIKMQQIARDECAIYLQTPHSRSNRPRKAKKGKA